MMRLSVISSTDHCDFGLVCTRVAMTASEEALTNAGILLHILSYEGIGSWLFLSPVCKMWKQCYEQLDPAAMRQVYPDANLKWSTSRGAFQSPSRLRFACEHGLRPLFFSRSDSLQQSAGAWCDVPTLLTAQELGLQMSDECIRLAAANGNLAVLKLLHIDQGVPLPADVDQPAAARGQLNVMLWLRELGYAFNEDTANAAATG
jgi:hypothetical protein